ncbi:hypothetical protein [Gordonia alkanivorans]|uniref:hypothetical protein n=1 Tax=Gordonia alkanivorans TaxID=84096 RepID=UPI000694E909|nr:hypothetical protein [Gordonia alkanivorans]
MSITFTTARPAQADGDFRLWCCGECVWPIFTSFAEAEAFTATVTDGTPPCGQTPWIIPVEEHDRPMVNVSAANGTQILTLLGLLPTAAPDLGVPTAEIEADVMTMDFFRHGHEQVGEATAEDFLGRILLAQALTGRDEGRPVDRSGRITDCGRPRGYLDERLCDLIEIAEWARSHQQVVVWS